VAALVALKEEFVMTRIIRCFVTLSLATGIIVLASLPLMAGQTCDPAKQNTVPDTRYVVRGNEVYDTTTKLTWQRCTMGRQWEEGAGCAGTALPMNWEMAMQQGRNGWRLPVKEELETLVSGNCVKPAINRSIFPDVGEGSPWWYWTSTPYTKDAAGAWAVHFIDGDSGYNFPHKKGAVRLVRSGH
jgi:hypothetical protein